MIGKNDAVFAWVGPSDSLNTSLNRLKGNSGAVQLVSLQTRQTLDDFFLNRQSVGVKVPGESCPRDTCPNKGAAP
jgi:hypothetical protein